MSTITGTPGTAWENAFDSPDDGDPRDAASYQIAHQSLAERDQYIYDRIELAQDGVQVGALSAASANIVSVVGGSYTVAPTPTLTRAITGTPFWANSNFSFVFSPVNAPTLISVACANLGAAFNWIMVPLRLPVGASVTFISALVSGNGAASAPASQTDRIGCGLIRRSLLPSPDSGAVLVTAFSLESVLANYNNRHQVVNTIGFSHTVGQDWIYYLGVRADVNGRLEYIGARVVFTYGGLTIGGF